MGMGIRASGAVRNLLCTSRSLSGRADRYNRGFFIKHKRELTTLPVLRYSSRHKKRWFKNPILTSTSQGRKYVGQDHVGPCARGVSCWACAGAGRRGRRRGKGKNAFRVARRAQVHRAAGSGRGGARRAHV